ncbi:MAG: hypothetical protein E6J02_01010 [Chloroflexi bacterium]|nr:MAG: hypothetical protein E6J02_01010 [Chloroflexota bacterium]TME17532.1 MAG: hypothetical protein E6I63_03495 [Chloroflexota bacterium]TME19535.1 MAG: hypothetical protein E6I70_03140 [Chloroflexota bacterium]
MTRSKPFRIALAAAGGLLLAAAAIAVTASAAGLHVGPVAAASSAAKTTPPATGTTKAQTYCQDFAKNFASSLGKSQDQVNTAARDAFKQTLKDAVSKGDLTQAEADKMLARMPAGNACAAALGRIGAAAKAGSAGALKQFMQAYLTAAASALHLSGGADELKADLKQGQSLSQIAAKQGVSEGDFKTSVGNSMKPQLDQAVTDKKITQQQEDALIKKFQAGDPPLWTRTKG